MSAFERERGRVRRVLTERGDTLQRIALRELGDAAKWVQLASINDLRPPYIVDETPAADAKVIKTGGPILIPDIGQAARAQAEADPAQTFGIDCKVGSAGLEVDADGDFAVVSGYANFVQALGIRLETRFGELMFHPGYGNGAIDLRGRNNDPDIIALNLSLIRRCVAADNRVYATRNFATEGAADTLRTTGIAVAIDGTRHPVETT